MAENRAPELEQWCREVHYYPRKKGWQSLPLRKPYIVASRRSSALLTRLLADTHPIWFEGLHSCAYLDDPRLKGRQKWVRMHNIEWQYYRQLAEQESRFFQKTYLQWEARRLRLFEPVLWAADKVLAISPADHRYLEERYVSAQYLPAFHPWEKVTGQPGQGSYCLYHGKLSVPENHRAAHWLIQHVPTSPDIPLYIAGADPLPSLIEAINGHEHVFLRHNPDADEMQQLMREAQVHLLPGFQRSGIKLKLLNALYTGRHVLATPQLVAGSGLENAVWTESEPAAFRQALLRLMHQSFTDAQRQARTRILDKTWNNRRNARQVYEWVNQRGEP